MVICHSPGLVSPVSEEGPTLIVFEEVILPAPFMGPSTILPLCSAGDGVESTGKCSPTASPKGKNLVGKYVVLHLGSKFLNGKFSLAHNE